MRGYLMTYRGYRIYDTYAGFVVYNDKGAPAFETQWGIPIIKDMIDDLIDKGGK